MRIAVGISSRLSAFALCALVTAALMATCMASVAEAQGLPSYTTDALCQQMARFGETFSPVIYGGCLRREQGAAVALESRWSSLPSSVRQNCIQSGGSADSFRGLPSYSTLTRCIDHTVPASPPPQKSKRFWYYRPEDSQGIPYETLNECLQASQQAGNVGVCVLK
jgi:hypothetical protein